MDTLMERARLAQRSHLAYGMDVTLEEARLLLARARVDVSSGRSPARAKVEQRNEVADAMSFGRWATRYFEFKSDARSGAERLADSTLALRRSVYERILAGPFGKLNLDEIKTLLDGLEMTGTAPTLRLAVRFLLLTGVRKGEFIGATWAEVDWDRAQWQIPAERMKAGKPHTVYLAEQALDILTTLRTCFPSSSFLHPGRYDSAEPISQATLNRTIAASVDRINKDRPTTQELFLPVSVHDLRRTFSSRLNDALFPEALVEARLAHQKKDRLLRPTTMHGCPGLGELSCRYGRTCSHT